MLFGQNDPAPHPSGRAFVPSQAHGGLTIGSTGLMPRESHNGQAEVTRPLPRHRRASIRAGLGSEQQQHTHERRHLDPHHFTNLSDEAKRQEGRYGRARVMSDQQQRATAYYATQQPSVAQPPGSECNLYLKSYYYTPLSKADRNSPPPKVPAGYRTDAQSTSFQLAEARLRRIKREHPEMQSQVDSILHDQHGDYGIVQTEEKLSRRVAVADYAVNANERVAQIEATTKYHGTPDLGSPAPAIERNVPYALGDAPRRADTQLSPPSHVRMYGGRNCSSTPNEKPVKPCDRHLHEGPVPYDSASLSGQAYPSPPPVGVRCGLYDKPTMVHMDARRHRLCDEDVDSLALKRARGRSGPSPSLERRPDFIFGPGPKLEPPRPTLSQRTEARWKAQERNAEERRSGKALYPQSYQPTSLW